MSQINIKSIKSDDGFRVFNARVYDLIESLISAGYSFDSGEVLDYSKYDDLYIERNNELIKEEDSDVIENVKRKLKIYGTKFNKELDSYKNELLLEMPLDIKNRLANAEKGSGHDGYLKGIVASFNVTYPVFWSPQAQRYSFFEFVSSTSTMHCITKFDLNKSFTKSTPKVFIKYLEKMIKRYNEIDQLEKEYLKGKNNMIYYPTIIFDYPNNSLHENLLGFNLESKKIASIISESVPGHVIFDMRSKTFSEFDYDEFIKSLLGSIPEFENDSYTVYHSKEELYEAIVAACPQGLLKTVRIQTNYLQLKTMYHQRKNHKLKNQWGLFTTWIENLPYFKELIINSVDTNIKELVNEANNEIEETFDNED
jgi:hypothetical protein